MKKQRICIVGDGLSGLMSAIALNNLPNLKDWPDKVKLMQKNWIGKSIGCEINFEIDQKEETIKIFTTRPDTIFGASFLALSIDHQISQQFEKDSKFI